MKNTLEIIHLRAVARSSAEIRRAIQGSLSHSDRSEPVVRLFCHQRVLGDLSVHLSYESTEPVERFSKLGLRLAEALKEYGLVEHSAWVECLDGERD